MAQRRPPYRSKALMRFAHEHLKPAPCAICNIRMWTRLHHFGFDSGQGMKPSDHMVARLCEKCAMKYELKWRALIRDNKWTILLSFVYDSSLIVRSYLEHLEQHLVEKDDCQPW